MRLWDELGCETSSHHINVFCHGPLAMLKVPSHRVYVSVVRFRQKKRCLITFRQNQHVGGFRKRWLTFGLDYAQNLPGLEGNGTLGIKRNVNLSGWPSQPSTQTPSSFHPLAPLLSKWFLSRWGIFGVSVSHWGPQNETFGCTKHENRLDIPAVHGLLFVIQRHQYGKSIGNIIFIISIQNLFYILFYMFN